MNINIYIKMNNNMNTHKNKIIGYIRREVAVTSSEIAKLLKISWNTAESYLKDLVIEGKIRRKKTDGVNLWLKK